MSTGARSVAQSPARRLRDWRQRPAHALGQCFLVDPNILRAVISSARISPREVVLEIGGGLGVLSELLAREAAHLHVVEVDHRLAPPLQEALAPFGNVSLHWGDALKLNLGELEPRPSVLVANLPYAIAATLLVRVACELAHIERCLVMVQREVGERLASAPVGVGAAARGQRPYGAPAALIQLSCEVKIVRAIPRSAFAPTPKVESCLLELRRFADPPPPHVRAFINAAFAHRRKALRSSLALVESGRAVDRRRLEGALARLGVAADVRAERLSPQQLAALAEAAAG